MFIVSDNESFNRIFEFLGQDYSKNHHLYQNHGKSPLELVSLKTIELRIYIVDIKFLFKLHY